MLPLLRHRRLALWATLVALVLGTLAPGVSRALAFARGDASPWSVVCSGASGPRIAASDGAEMPQPDLMESCPFCLPGLDTLGPPGVLPTVLPLAPLPAALPALFLHAPRPPFAWRAANPRAPPASA